MANILPPPPALPSGSVQYINNQSEKIQYVQTKGKRVQQEYKKPVQHETEEIKRQRRRDKMEGRIDFEALSRQIDPSIYRNTLFHNTCTAILAKGYHKSFTEIFELVQKQREEHRLAGPGAILLSPLIEEKPDKLDYLQVCLMGAEDAGRRGDPEAVYLSQRDLALHFDQTGDHWLSDHFHSRCLETGRMVKGDNRRKEGEAHFHVALAYENRNDLQTAVEHMETFHELTSINNWHTESGENLYRISCEHLRRIYTSIAEKSDDISVSIQYLQKAHGMSKKAKDTYQEGLACYRLGCAHEKNKDYDTALQCHKSFLERSRYHGDEVGVGNAYEALARCHEYKGDLENAVECLELYVKVSEKSGAIESLAKSCRAAGTIFNTLGDYKKTLDYFSKCYTYCQQLNDEEAIQSAQVQYGIAQAHFKMMEFTASIKDQSEGGILQLVQWKGKRETSAKPPKTNKEKKGGEGGGGGDEGKMERKESDRSVKIGTAEEEEEEEKGKEKEDNREGAS